MFYLFYFRNRHTTVRRPSSPQPYPQLSGYEPVHGKLLGQKIRRAVGEH